MSDVRVDCLLGVWTECPSGGLGWMSSVWVPGVWVECPSGGLDHMSDVRVDCLLGV